MIAEDTDGPLFTISRVTEVLHVAGCIVGVRFGGLPGAVIGGVVGGQIKDGVATGIQSMICRRYTPSGTWRICYERKSWRWVTVHLFTAFTSDIMLGIFIWWTFVSQDHEDRGRRFAQVVSRIKANKYPLTDDF